MEKEMLEYFSRLFCGDLDKGLYAYKSGPQLVDFFNRRFEFSDIYGSPFPSRWSYTLDKLEKLWKFNKLENFLNLIINKKYIMSEHGMSEIDALKLKNVIIGKINIEIQKNGYKLYQKNESIYLTKEDKDLEYIGEGGFAVVYLNKKTNLVIKKLTDENISEESIVSRFKREFQITKSLADEENVINVYDYNSDDCSYTMEYAELDLCKYIEEKSLSESQKLNIIETITHTMADIHNKNIIHRDISPSNILIVNGIIKISDFGLGKNLDVLHSHKTLYTKSFGQFLYCDPSQYIQLKEGDKKSDVYSIGKIINYIFNLDPFQDNHILSSVVIKATTLDRNQRYNDASEMLTDLKKCIEVKNSEKYVENMEKLIQDNNINDLSAQYLYEINPEKLCKRIINDKNYEMAIKTFINKNKTNLDYILDKITLWYDEACVKFEDYDKIANLFVYIFKSYNLDFLQKEKICKVLKYIGYSVNRYYVQGLIQKMIDNGMEPALEEIIRP